MAAGGRRTIAATLDQVTVKDGVTGKMVLKPRPAPAPACRQRGAADARSSWLIPTASPGDERAPAKITADQGRSGDGSVVHSLPTADGANDKPFTHWMGTGRQHGPATGAVRSPGPGHRLSRPGLPGSSSAFNSHKTRPGRACTGFGKTVVLAEIVRRTVERGHRVVILAHRIEIVRQIGNTLTRSGVSSAGCCPASPRPSPGVLVGMVQTVANRIATIQELKLLVVDEAHHATAGSYKKITDAWPRLYVLGVIRLPRAHGRPRPGRRVRTPWSRGRPWRN